jgi:hypothetical protein
LALGLITFLKKIMKSKLPSKQGVHGISSVFDRGLFQLGIHYPIQFEIGTIPKGKKKTEKT